MNKKKFEVQKEFYDNHWEAQRNLCIDEKCRMDFIVSNIKKMQSEFKYPLRILDLGCGRGWLTEILSNYGDVLGVDLSIDGAKTLYPGTLYPRLKFKEANIVTDEINGIYDIIVSSEVIEHLTSEHQHIYIKQAYYLLSKNGYLILTTPNKPNIEKLVKELSIKRDQLQPIENWLDEKSIVVLLNHHFEIISVESIMFYPVFFRKYKLFGIPYGFFYHSKSGYKLVDKLLKSGSYGLYLAIVAQKT